MGELHLQVRLGSSLADTDHLAGGPLLAGRIQADIDLEAFCNFHGVPYREGPSFDLEVHKHGACGGSSYFVAPFLYFDAACCCN